MDCNSPSSSDHGILQARMLEWVFPSPGDFPNPIKPRHHSLQADSLPSESPGKPLFLFLYLCLLRCDYNFDAKVNDIFLENRAKLSFDILSWA